MRKSYEDLVREARSKIRETDPAAARARLDANDGCAFLDVREADEVMRGTIPGAVSIPRGRLEGLAHDVFPDADVEVVVFCAAGNRSALATATLAEMGFANASSLAGGMRAWLAHGNPVGRPKGA